MIIYAIENTNNGKLLIGQTTRDITVRWKEHSYVANSNKHENPHFQYAWNKYGSTSFQVHLLMEVETQEELDILEDVFINMFSDQVYNLRSGGSGGCKFDESTKKRISEAGKRRHLNNPDELKTMSKIRWSDPKQKEWRIQKNKEIWSDPMIRSKMIGNILSVTPEQKSKWSKENWKNPEYKRKFQKQYGPFKSPDGKIFETVIGIREFCRNHNLDPSSMIGVQKGKHKQHKGWTKHDVT